LGKAYTYLSMRAVLLLSLMASGGFSQTTQSSEDNDQNYMQSSGESGEGSVDSDESSTESSVEVSAAPTPQSKEDKAAAKKAAKKAAKSQPPTPASWVPPPAGQILGGDPSTWTPLDLPQMDDPSTWDSPQPIMGRDPSTWTPLNQGQMGGNPSTWAPPQPIMGRDPSTWTPLNPVRDPSTWTGQLGGDPSTWTPLNLPQGPFGGAQFGSQFGSASQVSVGSQAAVGGDGSCQPNSGFMWCAAKQKCLQPWVETCLQFGQVSDTGVKSDKPIVPATSTGLYTPSSVYVSAVVNSPYIPTNPVYVPPRNPIYVPSNPVVNPYVPSGVYVGPTIATPYVPQSTGAVGGLYVPKNPQATIYVPPAASPVTQTFPSFAAPLSNYATQLPTYTTPLG